MDVPNTNIALAGSLEELKAKGRLVVHGAHRPILVVYDRGRVFALDNRCPHMGFPLDRGSVEDGILWTKPYNVYSKVDSESERFLEFETWWGSPVNTGNSSPAWR